MIYKPTGEVSPNALRQLRRLARDTWREYADLRRVALSALAAYRAAKRAGDPGRGSLLLAAEDAVGEAWELRRWAWIYQVRLEAAERLPVVPHGGRVSPAALARLRASGRLRSEVTP